MKKRKLSVENLKFGECMSRDGLLLRRELETVWKGIR
jgi:hypothetical protein